jgi:phospholipid transport system transporter-binding protein
MIQLNGTSIELEGPVTLESFCQLRELTRPHIGQAGSDWTVDWKNVKEVDSTALALIFAWQRESAAHGKQTRNMNLPPNLKSLAELYGISDLIPAA